MSSVAWGVKEEWEEMRERIPATGMTFNAPVCGRWDMICLRNWKKASVSEAHRKVRGENGPEVRGRIMPTL